MKDMVPKRADNKATDLVGAVGESALQLHVRLGCAVPQQDRKSSSGGVGPSEPLTALPGRIWVCVSCTVGSGYVIELVVWQNHWLPCVLTYAHGSMCIPWPPLPCDPELPRKLPRHQLFSELKKL